MFSCFCSWFHWIDCEYMLICPRGRGAWSHWSDFEYTFTFPFGWVSPELFQNLWSEALIITATSLCVVMRARALNFELPANNLKTNVAQCERLPMQMTPGSFRSSNLVLVMLMVCVSKKVFIALEIVSGHTKRVFNFPEWDRSRKKRSYLLIKPYSAEHRPCKQDGGPKVHTCCPRSSLQSE